MGADQHLADPVLGVGVIVEIDLGGCHHFQQLEAAMLEAAQLIGDPHVAQTIDGKATSGEARLESFYLGRVRSRKSSDVFADDVRDP